MVSRGRSARARDEFTADLTDPDGNGRPAADRAVDTQPLINAREAGRTLPLVEMKSVSICKDPQRMVRSETESERVGMEGDYGDQHHEKWSRKSSGPRDVCRSDVSMDAKLQSKVVCLCLTSLLTADPTPYQPDLQDHVL
ncbi:hypothetical protein GE061_016822 [Apolygus lucorum]|uniref:Uncharacterized protein n=1 Tax=Apolygus lucorum TaxID=248454 RepID=A0A8S9XJW6_APOLU|nr:hypothetical protein GE061_016820 [Apolygus lucorum]KAF6208368.1 hypothetical protein GE061_016822 [Apolygus lucorum]